MPHSQNAFNKYWLNVLCWAAREVFKNRQTPISPGKAFVHLGINLSIRTGLRGGKVMETGEAVYSPAVFTLRFNEQTLLQLCLPKCLFI